MDGEDGDGDVALVCLRCLSYFRLAAATRLAICKLGAEANLLSIVRRQPPQLDSAVISHQDLLGCLCHCIASVIFNDLKRHACLRSCFLAGSAITLTSQHPCR